MKALITVISVAGIAIAAIACAGPSAAPPTATEDAIADAPAPVVNPSAEPDDEIEVFASDRDGDNEIYSRNADGVEKQLTDNDADDISPALSPDGASIIFASNEFGDYDIRKMNADGTRKELLTTNSADDISPYWSDDGARIYFSSDRDGKYELWSMDANGFNETQQTDDGVIEYNTNVAQFDAIFAEGLDSGLNLWAAANEDIAFEYAETDFDVFIRFIELPESADYIGLWCENHKCAEEDVWTRHDEIEIGAVENISDTCRSLADEYGVNEIANTVAHEIGHQLGLDHHYDESHILWGPPITSSGYSFIPNLDGTYEMRWYNFSDGGYNIPSLLPGTDEMRYTINNRQDEINAEWAELNRQLDAEAIEYDEYSDAWDILNDEWDMLEEDLDTTNEIVLCIHGV